MDPGFGVTNVLAGSAHTFPAHSCEDNVTVTKGKAIRKDEHLFADCDTRGWGEAIDQGQQRLYLVLAALLSADQCLSVYDSMKTAFQLSGSCGQGHSSSI